MSASATALLVIDAQESFRYRPYWRVDDLTHYLERQQALIYGAKRLGIPVVKIFHIEDTGPFCEASGMVTTMTPLRVDAEAIFRKRRHSALIGSGLDVWLNQEGIRHVIISGIRTEECCETTTRHASDLGYAADFVSEATLTFAMTDHTGREWSASEIRARTELVLADRFARIVTVEGALAARRARAA